MSARKFDLFRPKGYGNVVIDRVNGFLLVKLHGNTVVAIDETTKRFRLDDCGWVTATTTTAMNTALRQFRPDVHVRRSRGTMIVSFANGEEEAVLDPQAWYGFGEVA